MTLSRQNRLLAVDEEVTFLAGRKDHAPPLEAEFAKQFDEAT